MEAYLGNDHAVRLSGARTIELATGETRFLDAGDTVTFRVQSATHVDLAGETWPQALTYIAASEGDFIGVLRASVPLEAGVEYRFVATVDAGTDQVATWDLPLRAFVRTI